MFNFEAFTSGFVQEKFSVYSGFGEKVFNFEVVTFWIYTNEA